MFIPGVDMALVTRQVVMHGRPAAFATLGGLLVGGLMHAAFAALGLSTLLLTSATAYTTIKIAGAIYLMGLGLQTIWSSRRRSRLISTDRVGAADDAKEMSLRNAFVLGFISDATNPKVAIFFLTFLPQFVSPGEGDTLAIASLGVLFNAIATTWWIGYVLILERAAEWLRRPTLRRVVENVSGTILIALGLRVLVERR